MPIPILVYHQIDEPVAPGAPFGGLVVSPRNFVSQMTWLKRLGWTGLSMRDLLPYLKGDRSGRVVGITFDDGFSNVHRNALPVLEALGFTATSYIVSRQIGGSNEWDRAIGVPHWACMTKAELLEWCSYGHEIGAHTLDHVRLTAMPRSEARQQIRGVRHELEDKLGRKVQAFCYPYGDVSAQVRDLVADAGYATGTTTRRGRFRRKDDLLLLPRRAPQGTDGWLTVLRKCFSG